MSIRCFLLVSSLFLMTAQSATSQTTFLLDEFGDLACDHHLGRMDAIFQEARRYPTASIYFLLYEGKQYVYNMRKARVELKRPPVGQAEARIRSIKNYADYRRVDKSRFVFVKAGFRDKGALETWIVPPGASAPKASNTVPKMRYRPGKAVGYCTDCCGP
jgi:hypothetical protein